MGTTRLGETAEAGSSVGWPYPVTRPVSLIR